VARAKIPDALARRHLIERDQSAEKALRIGEAYLEEGRRVEAVEFLAKAGAAEQLGELRRVAIDEGDTFLLRAVARTDGEPPSAEEWAELAAAAEAAGKLEYARDARRQAERGEE